MNPMKHRSGSFKELETLDEDDLQRKELERLLTTAKDEERKDFIKQALLALDTGTQSSIGKGFAPNTHIPALHPSKHAHIFGATKIPVDTAVSRMRPASAQRRRPSISTNLDSIPENRTILHRVKHEVGVDVDITLDDIDDITASSSDPRFPPSNIFRSPAVAKGPRHWIPTGLLPQTLQISLSSSWLVRKIDIISTGLDEVDVQMGGLGVTSRFISPLRRLDDRSFTFDSSTGPRDGAPVSTAAGANGSKLAGGEVCPGIPCTTMILSFKKSTDLFFAVFEIKIRGSPDG